MNKTITVCGLTAALLFGTACEQAATGCPPVPTQRVITIPEDYTATFDALPGDRLDVLMTDTEGAVERCDHMGGRLVVDLDRMLTTCEGVDF